MRPFWRARVWWVALVIANILALGIYVALWSSRSLPLPDRCGVDIRILGYVYRDIDCSQWTPSNVGSDNGCAQVDVWGVWLEGQNNGTCTISAAASKYDDRPMNDFYIEVERHLFPRNSTRSVCIREAEASCLLEWHPFLDMHDHATATYLWIAALVNVMMCMLPVFCKYPSTYYTRIG